MTHSIHKTNLLAKETSPYLKQHGENPVDWYPWGDEALSKARKEKKPILLSIGYAACHWCHVMAHESFEDEETAELMNKLFVNIKVDREERPDLDKIYQTSHYLLTQQPGGWPLTVFLTPNDLTPFFSGTYFPREARNQLPAFKDVLKTLANIFQNHPEEIAQQNMELLKILQNQGKPLAPIQLTDEPLHKALSQLQQHYDSINGGFDTAPKFPQPSKLEFLLQSQSLMAAATMQHMAEGGIYDQLEGGFFRYSVDASWQIPHFEKMLYDNGQLLYLYALASNNYDETFFKEISQETAQWSITKMQSPEGGFFSSIDADSEGHEGKFYVWRKEEIKENLTPKEFKIIELYFGLDKPPNFENHWHFVISQSLQAIAQQLSMPFDEVNALVLSAKKKLLALRHKRIPPHLDKKILTAWNGLMIKGLLTAGQNLQMPQFIQAGQQAITFIQQKLWRDKRLFASYGDGKAYLSAYLDDYAFLIDALLTAIKVAWNTQHLLFAIDLADALLDHFYDATNGGFFFTANDQEKVLYRPKTMMDEAIPSGNGVAVRVLLTLGHLLGEERYLDAAEKTLQAAWPYLLNYPAEHCALLGGLQDYLYPPQIIVLRGTASDMKKWQSYSQARQKYVLAIPDDAHDLPSQLALRKSGEKTRAYICQGMQCRAAIDDFEEFKTALK